jgi:hypothetical protein
MIDGKEAAKGLSDIVSKGVSGDLSDVVKEEDKIFDAAFKLGGFFNTLKGSFKEIDDVIVSLDKKFASVIQTMGVGRTYSGLIKENFAKAAPEVFKMGLGMDDIEKTQQAILTNTKKNIVLNEESLKNILATQKVTGIAADALSKGFLDAGMEISHISDEMYDVVKISQRMGVNAQAVSSMVVSNLDKLNKFTFKDGVDGLARMAAKAAMFRIDMSETFNLADKLLSPENAIEVASALQRLGGATSQLASPLRLMDLAQNNVPELQNQLGKLVEKYTFFDEKTKSFQIMPGARRELKAVSDSLGISVETLTNMSIEGSKLKKKMSEINFSGLNFSKEQKEQIANLSQLNKNTGEYEISFKDKSGETITRSIDQLNTLTKQQQDDFNGFLEKQSTEKGKTNEEKMVDLATEQLGKAGEIVAKIEAFKNAIPVSVAGSKVGETYLGTALDRVSTKFDSVTSSFNLNTEGVLKGLNNNAETLNELIVNVNDLKFGEAFKNLGNLTGDFAKLVEKNVLEPALNDLENTGVGKAVELIGLDVKDIKNLISGAGKAEDFIWRPGQGISKFSENDLVIGGTGLVNKKTQTTVDTTSLDMKKGEVNKTESTVGGEITLKVVVDSSTSKNITISEANIIGERVAAALKSRPDLQDEFKKALNFTSNDRK